MFKFISFLALLIHLASATHHELPPNGSSDLESSETLSHLSAVAPSSASGYSSYGQHQYVSQETEAPRLTLKAAKLQALMMLKQAKLGGLLLKEYARSQMPQTKLTVTHVPVPLPVLKLVKVPAKLVAPVYATVYPPVVKPPVVQTSYVRPQPSY